MVLAGLLGTLFGPGAAQAAKPPREDPDLQALAAKAYAQQTGVSVAEATRRLVMQDKAVNLAPALESIFAEDYGGMWFSTTDRGRIKIGVPGGDPASGAKKEKAKDKLAERGLRGEADFVPVQSSLSALVEAHQPLDRRLSSLLAEGKVRTAVDTSSNALVIHVASGLSDAEAAEVRSAAADAPVPAEVRPTGRASLLVSPDKCNLPFCDWPLRGGVRIVSEVGGCTAGFLAQSRSDAKEYVFTAGHCATPDPGVWSTRETGDSLFEPIGRTHNYAYPGEHDTAIVRINPLSYWAFTGPYVVVDAGPDTTYDQGYEIYSESSTIDGQTVCRTSAFSFTMDEDYTTCGQVINPDVNITYTSGETVNHVVWTDMCGVGGSSGGPVYKTHYAYGIHVAGRARPCEAFYESAERAENAMNVDILHADPPIDPYPTTTD